MGESYEDEVKALSDLEGLMSRMVGERRVLISGQQALQTVRAAIAQAPDKLRESERLDKEIDEKSRRLAGMEKELEAALQSVDDAAHERTMELEGPIRERIALQEDEVKGLNLAIKEKRSELQTITEEINEKTRQGGAEIEQRRAVLASINREISEGRQKLMDSANRLSP